MSRPPVPSSKWVTRWTSTAPTRATCAESLVQRCIDAGQRVAAQPIDTRRPASGREVLSARRATRLIEGTEQPRRTEFAQPLRSPLPGRFGRFPGQHGSLTGRSAVRTPPKAGRRTQIREVGRDCRTTLTEFAARGPGNDTPRWHESGGPQGHRAGTMDHAVETSVERVRCHLRRPHARGREPLTNKMLVTPFAGRSRA